MSRAGLSYYLCWLEMAPKVTVIEDYYQPKVMLKILDLLTVTYAYDLIDWTVQTNWGRLRFCFSYVRYFPSFYQLSGVNRCYTLVDGVLKNTSIQLTKAEFIHKYLALCLTWVIK